MACRPESVAIVSVCGTELTPWLCDAVAVSPPGPSFAVTVIVQLWSVPVRFARAVHVALRVFAVAPNDPLLPSGAGQTAVQT